MKTYLITALLLTIFSGCSEHNAFSDFNLTQTQAKSEDSIRSSKIFKDDTTVGVVSAIYLNSVEPDTFKDYEYFYLSLYTKEDATFQFYLNKKEALEIEMLKKDSKYAKYIDASNDWKKYFLLKFTKQSAKTLALQAKSSTAKSHKIIFKRDD